MKFSIKKIDRQKDFSHKYPISDISIARKFAKLVRKELGDFVMALALFGSSARGERQSRDIDILIIIDDVHLELNREVVQTYRIILAKLIAEVSPERLHVQTMNWTTFWEYVRAGDPVAINILRDSIALIDTGFFDPLQTLLFQGRIRPSHESIWTYYSLAPASLQRAKANIDMAVIDLYWAVIDSAHAALMSIGEIPPSPAHVADMIKKKLVEPGHIDERYAYIMEHMYDVSKKIMHREVASVDGKTYDKYVRLAHEFVNEMKKFIEKKKEN
jgi:uncharacterized protein (UPF0332 family)/predicted nucleotidyltransferase